MDCDGSAFLFLKNKFPKISEAKLKEGIFESQLNVQEAAAWLSFKKIVTNFLGNYRSENY